MGTYQRMTFSVELLGHLEASRRGEKRAKRAKSGFPTCSSLVFKTLVSHFLSYLALIAALLGPAGAFARSCYFHIGIAPAIL